MANINFNQDEYKEINQFIYIGDLDTGEGGTTIVYNRLHPTQRHYDRPHILQQMEFLHNNFGEVDPMRLENEIDYLNSIGYENIEFKLYQNVAHEVTHQMVIDFMELLFSHTNSNLTP